MFYDIYCELCAQKGLTPSGAAAKIGFNRASVTVWKNSGRAPKQDLLLRIAEYFGVTVDYLLGNDDYWAIQRAHEALEEALTESPDLPSGKRLNILFNASGYELDIVCHNLDLPEPMIQAWMDGGKAPEMHIVDLLCGVFHTKPDRLLNAAELSYYMEQSKDFAKITPTGSGEREVSDDDLKFALFGTSEIDDDVFEDVKALAKVAAERAALRKKDKP